MPRKEKIFDELNTAEYNIAGNSLRVWRDGDGKIVFLVDETIDDYKPNVLLVMNSFGDRKWDDVLQNDYGIDLETVRPRRDNLYQKLDIEYYGLDEYERLINAYENGDDIDDALRAVIEFRDAVARRAATVRLTTALDIVEQSQATLSRTEHAIQGMQDRRKKLRARLAKQKSFIGQEPTKQSASRILHVESQIESNDEKIARAQKRIENAKRRIAAAMDEADEAREFLARRRNKETIDVDIKKDDDKEMKKTSFDKDESFDNQDNYVLDVPDGDDLTVEPKEQDMDENEEVKPLLDQDPEILDEEIAFKPVKFDEIEPESGYVKKNNKKTLKNNDNPEPVDVNFNDDIGEERYKGDVDAVVRPLSFSDSKTADNYSETGTEYEKSDSESDGVLDTIKTVEEPVPADTDTTGAVTNTQYENNTVVRPAVYNNARPSSPVARPVSPISGGDARPVDVKVNSRPTIAYYLLLILLIALSVFALWLYQQKNGTGMPVLNPAPVENPQTSDDVDNIGQGSENIDVSVVSSEDKPINIVYPNGDILRAADPAPVIVESEEDVLARKEPYNVSQHENMFVAPDMTVPEPVVRETNVVTPDVIVTDDIITVPMPAPNYVEEDVPVVIQNGPQEYYNERYAADQDVPVQTVNESQEYYNEWYAADQDIPVQTANVPQGYYDYNTVGYQQPRYDYVEPQGYMPQVYNNQYVQDDVVYEEDVPVPTSQKHLSIHDGGQYSVSYEETTY